MPRLLVLCVVVALLTSCRTAPGPAITPELVERNNRAVGLMGQFDFSAAVDAFATIQTAAPDWPEGRLNLAIALMNRQREGDPSRAEALLRGLLDTPAVARRARYTLGLLLAHDGRDAEAVPLLTSAADADPPDGSRRISLANSASRTLPPRPSNGIAAPRLCSLCFAAPTTARSSPCGA